MSLQSRLSGFITRVGDEFQSIRTALSSKQATLVSGTNVKTINSSSILGSGDLIIDAIGFVNPTSIYSTAVTALPTSAEVVSFTNENFDVDGFFNVGTDATKLTIPTGSAGYYRITFRETLDVNGTPAHIRGYIYVNGVCIATDYKSEDESWDASDYHTILVSVLTYLDEGDYVQAYHYANSTTIMQGTIASDRPTLELQPLIGRKGADGSGDSAYQTAIYNGFSGTEAEWLTSLAGSGISAYDIAVANGFSGTESQWLVSLIGAPTDPDSITIDELHSMFKGRASMAALNVDWETAQVFTKTLTGNSTLTFSNLFIGVKDLEISGDYTLGFPTWLKIISGEYDGTVLNLIQIVITNNTVSSESGWCTISQEA